MRLAVSNIAWTEEEEPAAAGLLRKLGVRHVEIAPTKRWQDPTQAGRDELAGYKKFWEDHGLEVVACQSMLYNRPDLKMFGSPANRQATLEYLERFMDAVKAAGVQVMVFGSPKNRQRGGMPEEQALEIARSFFGRLGSAAKERGMTFCLEPNAERYGCDFVTGAAEGISLVKDVDNPGFRLHLDTGCMALAGDDPAKSIEQAAPLLSHFHISSPMLEPVEDRPDVAHAEAAAALRGIGYEGFVSIEMAPGKPGKGSNLERLRRAVGFAQKTYLD